MNENKLKDLWQKIKDKWEDPEFRKKTVDAVIKFVGCAVGMTAVSYLGYKWGYRDGATERYETDNLSFDLMKESGFITFDESKEDDFVRLLKRNGYREHVEK